MLGRGSFARLFFESDFFASTLFAFGFSVGGVTGNKRGTFSGLGLYAKYQSNPDHFRENYDTVLSRAGMDTAEELGQAFGIDVTDVAFWTSSLDVLRARMLDYEKLAQKHL